MPAVSIVIAARNPGPLLHRAVDSLLSQTFTDWECIVVDDGSEENFDWVTSTGDQRIALLRQDNRGPSVARNVGVGLSRGDLLAFLDADDEWLPTKLEEQMKAVSSRPEASFWHTGFTWEYPSHAIASDVTPVTYHGLLTDQHVCLSSILVRKSRYWAVGGHDPLVRYAEDLDLCLRLLLFFGNADITPDPLVRYYLHEANATRDDVATEAGRRSVLQRHRRYAELNGDRESTTAARAGLRRTRRHFAHRAIDSAREAGHAHRPWTATTSMMRAARLSPVMTGRAVLRALSRR